MRMAFLPKWAKRITILGRHRPRVNVEAIQWKWPQCLLPRNGTYACVSDSMNDEQKTGPQTVASVSSPQPVSYGWGIGSIVLGMVGGFTSYILCLPIPLVLGFSIPLLLVGLVLGLVGTFRKNSSVGVSIAGTVLCGLLLAFIVLSIFMLGASGVLEGFSEGRDVEVA